ncbi:MAG: hypothetical protein KKE00_13255 [Proteobacteria bacterium]|nr:hypothetical protein [Pseudomonadota bacterium]MBU1397561.1 hypothetical protein [Pseudomonadota bacterium]MBU1571457.1 hypothetical protein [Pseudomonadota bacterium]
MKTIKIMEGSRGGEVRCLACFMRFWPRKGTERAKCPGCGVEWKISWSYPRTAKIRGSGWETYPTGDKI